MGTSVSSSLLIMMKRHIFLDAESYAEPLKLAEYISLQVN